MSPLRLASIALAMLVQISVARADGPCLYRDAAGALREAADRRVVPLSQRKDARCGAEIGTARLARPDEMTLQGNVRSVEMASPLGTIKLRWSRQLESLFGKTPARATQQATAIVARLLRSRAFPADVSQMRLEWNVVFMGSDMNLAEVPASLATNCHPGWMVPPSDIYIVVDRIAAGCAGASRGTPSEVDLAKVLIHEFGHAVEHHMLANQAPLERMRAEGFATWFEAEGLKLLSPSDAAIFRQLRHSVSRNVLAGEQWSFNGSAEDYFVASLFFESIVQRRGLGGIPKLYDRLRTGTPLAAAVAAELTLAQDALWKLMREVASR